MLCHIGSQASAPQSNASGTPDERYEAQRWVAAKFAGFPEIPLPEARLTVLANNDPVQKNARTGQPLRIAGQSFERGLFCHAVSQVKVRLPGPGRTFTATVGVDSNEQTFGGRGSVVFAVKVGGQERFRSPVMREGMPGVPIAVDLNGATEFILEVDDAGDGIACDQADWAEARVRLEDGDTVWLGDMVMVHPHTVPYSPEPPFSFTYGGQPSIEFLPPLAKGGQGGWNLERRSRLLDDQRTEHILTYTDPRTGLVVRCVAVEYHDFPTVEWTLYFKNTGAEDTPILENLQALDLRLEHYRWPHPELNDFVLHHFTGSPCTPTDYQPHRTVLGPQAEKRITAAGGRPTNSDLPYFNIEWPSEGVIVAVGWPGQWAARFIRDDGVGLRVQAGQEWTHFTLHPGEEVRTPLIVLQFWKGDWVRAQNVWRRWMVDHNLPRPGGKLVPTHYGACFGNLLPRADEELAVIDGFVRERIPLDYWFIDAGWYPNGGSWVNTGTWEVDKTRFPRGLREVADHVHKQGMKFVVWFEPERVTAGSWLAETHPEWVLGGRNGGLLNLGHPEAWNWVVDHFDHLLTTQGIDVYRQDFNIDPLSYWRAHDAEDRQGITEIRHVTGYLAYWDELLRRHPNLWIDTCASGGRRNDLETLRRSVPLLRSDYWNDPVAQQCQTLGIALWIPYFGSGMGASDPYWFRSCIFPASRIGWDARRTDLDYPLLRRMIEEFRQVEPYLLGDFYPLTPYSLANDVWMAWQFDRPELGAGVVQAFRRADCPDEAARFKLRGLEPEARYTVKNLDSEGAIEMTGRELMEEGLPVVLPNQPAAAVVIYKQVEERIP